MKGVLRVVLLVMLLSALAGGGYWIYRSQSANATVSDDGGYTQVVTAEVGDLTASISVVGQLEAVQSAILTFEQMSGTAKVQSLGVQTGEMVTTGQVLATIDPTPYQQALDEAKSSLQAAEDSLAELQTPPTALEVAQADLAVAKAQFQLETAQQSLDDLLDPDIPSLQSAVTNARLGLAQAEMNLLTLQQDTSAEEQIARLREADAEAWAVYREYAAKVHSESDDDYHAELMLRYNKMMDAQDALVTAEVKAQLTLLQAQMSVRKNEQLLADAQEALAEARAGGDSLKLAQAELAVRQAEVNLEAAQLQRAEMDDGVDATAVAAAQATVDKRQLAVDEAEAALAGTELVAPFSGTILETHVGWRPGGGEQLGGDVGGSGVDAGGGVGGRDDDPAGERGAEGEHQL